MPIHTCFQNRYVYGHVYRHACRHVYRHVYRYVYRFVRIVVDSWRKHVSMRTALDVGKDCKETTKVATPVPSLSPGYHSDAYHNVWHIIGKHTNSMAAHSLLNKTMSPVPSAMTQRPYRTLVIDRGGKNWKECRWQCKCRKVQPGCHSGGRCKNYRFSRSAKLCELFNAKISPFPPRLGPKPAPPTNHQKPRLVKKPRPWPPTKPQKYDMKFTAPPSWPSTENNTSRTEDAKVEASATPTNEQKYDMKFTGPPKWLSLVSYSPSRWAG